MPTAMVNFREGDRFTLLTSRRSFSANSIKSLWGDMKASSRFYEARERRRRVQWARVVSPGANTPRAHGFRARSNARYYITTHFGAS